MEPKVPTIQPLILSTKLSLDRLTVVPLDNLLQVVHLLVVFRIVPLEPTDQPKLLLTN